MSARLNVPNLENVGGSINVNGNRDISERNFPSLKFVAGDMHLAMSGFARLPPMLTSVGGDIYLSSELPKSLRDDCLAKKAAGIVKGEIYLIGGKVANGEDGKVVYEQKVLLKTNGGVPFYAELLRRLSAFTRGALRK